MFIFLFLFRCCDTVTHVDACLSTSFGELSFFSCNIRRVSILHLIQPGLPSPMHGAFRKADYRSRSFWRGQLPSLPDVSLLTLEHTETILVRSQNIDVAKRICVLQIGSLALFAINCILNNRCRCSRQRAKMLTHMAKTALLSAGLLSFFFHGGGGRRSAARARRGQVAHERRAVRHPLLHVSPSLSFLLTVANLAKYLPTFANFCPAAATFGVRHESPNTHGFAQKSAGDPRWRRGAELCLGIPARWRAPLLYS